MTDLIYLYQKTENYVFERDVLQKNCEILSANIDNVIEDLLTLKAISKQELTINGEKRVLYSSRPNHNIIALFIFAREIGTKEGDCLQVHERNIPFLNE